MMRRMNARLLLDCGTIQRHNNTNRGCSCRRGTFFLNQACSAIFCRPAWAISVLIMGAGSSVRSSTATTGPTSIVGHQQEFEANVKLLASKYHDLRLRSRGGGGGGGGGGEECAALPSALELNAASASVPPQAQSLISPLPRAERRRLSRQLWRHSRSTAASENIKKIGFKVVAAANPDSDPSEGRSSGVSRHDRKTSSGVGMANDRGGGGGTAVRESPDESQQYHFVQRDEMIELARDLGYNITPEQSGRIFDMLDSQRQGKIPKDDLYKHFLPLLQKVGGAAPSRKGSTWRKGSTKRASPKRPRPSTPHPIGTKTPPRPAGTPPATAKRRNVSLPPATKGQKGGGSPGLAPITSASSSPPKEKNGSSTADTLKAISPPNFREKPSNFWRKSGRGGGDDGTPASTSLAPLGGAEEPENNESQTRCDETDNKQVVETRGEALPSEEVVPESEEVLVTPRGVTEGKLEPVTGVSVGTKSNQSTGGSQDRQNDAADKKTGAEACVPTAGERRSERCSVTTNSIAAAAAVLRGKKVLEWTAADVQTWVRALPRGLAAFAEAEAFANGWVDGKKLATLTLSDIKRKEFRHATFKAKIPTALWVEIKQIQQTAPTPVVATAPVHFRFSPGQTIVDEAVGTPLCTVKRSVGQGAFGEVYNVVWTGIGVDWGTTLAMKTVRLADISSSDRDEYRVLLMEEILTAIRVKPHPNLVNVRFAHIMGFCSESEEYFCFEDFVTGRNLEELLAEGQGELYDGTPAEVQGRLLSYSIQLARGLGHIHRCGVLHQDMKSANVMVSSDGGVFITDFGFATAGKFGPPPPLIEKTVSGPAAGPGAAGASATTTTDTGPKLTGSDVAEAHACGAAAPPADSRCPTVDTNGGSGKGAKTSSERVPDSDVNGSTTTPTKSKHRVTEKAASGSVAPREEARGAATSNPEDQDNAGEGGGFGGTERPPNRHSVLYGTLKGYTPRYQSPEVSAIIDEKSKAAAVAAAVAAAGATAAGVAQAGGQPSPNQAPQDPSPPQVSRNHGGVDGPSVLFTHRSDMWAAGVVVLELYAGGLSALTAGRGENASDLLETLVSNTASVMTEASAENGGVPGKQTKDKGVPSAFAKDGKSAESGAADGAGKRPTKGKGCTKNRNTFRVDMPAGVLAILREIFQWEAGDRPVSVELVAARLSQTLARMLKDDRAVVPCPTSGSPSSSSLCEEAAAPIQCEENHAKVGRLHMWLGKALFLKGEDRREQALQEYREGVRVLEESKADRRSPSMALFRWYLGKALLETGEVDEALPHLTEAVSIEPENAKYRHALGLAKCATGDEEGARGDLLEAALLDEEDAEDRYQLRLRRMRDKRSKSEDEQRVAQESQEAAKSGSSEEASGGKTGGEPQEAATTPKSVSLNSSPRLAQSQLLAIEKAAASTRTYALENLGDYRMVGRGGGEHRGSGGRTTMDATGKYFGGESRRDAATTLPESRWYSLGDEIVCSSDDALALSKQFEPIRCCRYPPRTGDGDSVDNDEVLVIDGFLSPDQASLNFRGEAYTATAATAALRRQKSDESTSSGGDRAYHVVHARFGPSDKNRPAATDNAPTPSAAQATSSAASSGVKQLAPITEKQPGVRVRGTGGVSTYSSPLEATSAAAAPAAGVSSRGGSSKSRRALPPINHQPVASSANFQREEEFVPMLKAAGRAAMVGFHAHIAGTLHRLTWGAGEVTLVASSLPATSFTLREACVSGNLYRGTGKVSGGGGGGGSQGHRASAEGPRAPIVVDRMLELARQMAAAISHCHCRGVLLRDITPNDVLVTPHWKAKLRPNYSCAYEGKVWSTVSVREQQQHQYFRQSLVEEPLTAPFTNATSPDYQSPEIARMRSESDPRQRVSGRAMRLSAAATSSLLSPRQGHQEESQPLSCSPTGRDSIRGGSGGGDSARGVPGSDTTVHDLQSESGGGSGEDRSRAGNTSRRGGDTRSGSDRRREGDDKAGEKIAGTPSGDGGGGGGGSSGGPPMLSACESDIWAWALMVLQMFSDEVWPPGNGQKGLAALEALLQRRQGVDAWTTEDVISWLRDIGLWSEKAERQIRAFKITGPKLLVPTCRRDIVEKLGLFIADGELSCKLWESIAGGLQRWNVPPCLAKVLRKCLADLPGHRYSTMAEVCRLLRGVAAAGDAHDEADIVAMPTVKDGDDNAASDGLRTGMIINDIGACLCGRGQTEEAERYYKMALLSSDKLFQAYYNLGLIYIKPAFGKFREAKQVFDAAAELMDSRDPRRRASIEHSRAAERKSNFYQSQEMMKALSGKYGSIFPNRSRNRESVSGGGGGQGIVGGTAKHNRSAGDDKTDTSRRRTFPLEQQKVSSSSKSLVSSGRASASDATPSSGGEVAEVSTSSRPSSRGRTPSKAFF